MHYVTDCTRPDVAYCTGQLAHYLADSGKEHYAAAKQCYLYLKGTCDYWLVLGNQANASTTSLVGYADSDGMTTYSNKPIMGYAFTYQDSLISWSSKRGSLVTLSVTEAELYAPVVFDSGPGRRPFHSGRGRDSGQMGSSTTVESRTRT